MNLTHLIGYPGIIEDPFGGRGFSGIDMGHNPYIPDS